MPPIQPHVLHRVLLAKAFLRDAERASHTSRNDLALSQIVVDMHDAMDNLLGAVASHRAVRLGPRDAMVDAYNKIETAGHALGNRAEIDQLNAMRNAIKHQGVPQNAAAVLALLPVIHEFGNRVARDTFGLTLDEASLADMVEDKATRDRLHDARRLIENGHYRDALLELARIRFDRAQHMWLEVEGWWKRDQQNIPLREQRFVFPPTDRYTEKKLECLELGIDPDEMTRFEWLVPRVGYDNLEDKNVIFEYHGLFWHARNWSYENAIFCFNFLVSYLAAKQKTPAPPTIVRLDHKRNRLRFIRSSDITDQADNVLASYRAGEEVVCWAERLVENQWQNHGKAEAYITIYREDGSALEGFVKKADVAVIGGDIDPVYR